MLLQFYFRRKERCVVDGELPSPLQLSANDGEKFKYICILYTTSRMLSGDVVRNTSGNNCYVLRKINKSLKVNNRLSINHH